MVKKECNGPTELQLMMSIDRRLLPKISVIRSGLSVRSNKGDEFKTHAQRGPHSKRESLSHKLLSYCSDIDGTLCSNADGDYLTAKPLLSESIM